MAGRGRGAAGAPSGGIAAFGNSIHRPAADLKNKRKEVGEHHDGSFGVYMAHKIQKLRNQNSSFVSSLTDSAIHTQDDTVLTHDKNASESATAAPVSRLFEGVHVFVDGYTTPSKEELRAMLLMHGGGFEHYETSLVTHIIATNLATSKLLQLKKRRHPPPVVHPDWIVKSIEANQLLPTHTFAYKAFADPTQGSVVSLSASLSAGEAHSNHLEGDTSRSDDENRDGFSESDGGGSDEEDHEALASQYASQQVIVDHQQQVEVNNEPNSIAHGPTRTNSTRDGPSFVRHFFAKSRLHHIGSWRFTFQQRAAEFTAKYKGKPFPRAPVSSTDRVILHVDMDCFFVAVAVRDKPQYQQGVPVAIAHSGNAGSSEISSCNYIARGKGLRAGMFMQSAKELCPELVVLPYQFEDIQACSFQIYEIFFSRTPYVQAMSCDEAYLEFAAGTDGEAMANEIRQAIFDKTQCTASVGVSYNILLAKLATREAKPNGMFRIATPQDAEPFLNALRVTDLPGVGHRMSAKMEELGLEHVDQLRLLSKSELQTHFGKATGEMLYSYARGMDPRPISIEANTTRKSVSAVVNFGIRFQTWQDATEFMMALAEELSTRLKSLKLSTKFLTLLIKKRREGAPVEPAKFMGMGRCDSFSRSQILSEATDSDLVIGRTCIELLRQLRFPVEELRGVGIQATKLASQTKPTDSRAGERFRAWLAAPDESSTAVSVEPTHNAKRVYTESLSQINMSVLNELPSPIREEVLNTYRTQRPTAPAETAFSLQPPRATAKTKQRAKIPAARDIFASTAREPASASNGNVTALNDIRFSQVDEDVYQALPISLRKEIKAYAKKSTTTSASKTTVPTTTPLNPQPTAKVTLQSIEELMDALSNAVIHPEVVNGRGLDQGVFETRVFAAFDAIFSRILVEIDSHALDSGLRMLRFVRRKCVQDLLSATPSGTAIAVHPLVRLGFNQVLHQINEELRQSYRSVFPSRLVSPL